VQNASPFARRFRVGARSMLPASVGSRPPTTWRNQMRREVVMISTLFLAAGCAGGRGGAAPEDTAHVNAMAHEHADETPAANASTTEPRQEVTAEEVVYGTVGGRELRGYMARPASARAEAPLPGVVMIHEWWGLNENI